jgi:hypothetical protein
VTLARTLVAAALLGAGTLAAGAGEGWVLAGRQGLVLQVVVPEAEARERAAYDRELARLCAPEQTCFVNFYANPTGAAVALPLADAIAQQPTATFRRSGKRGTAVFTWSCRLQVGTEPCF